MPRAAVALATTPTRAPSPQPAGPARRIKLTRGHIVAIGIGMAAIWLVFVFGRALTDLDRATARQQVVAGESATLGQRLEADRRELQLVQTDAFQQMQARSFGMGMPGERVFALEAGAPSPPPIVPLGSSSASLAELPPLEAWLQLLFGS